MSFYFAQVENLQLVSAASSNQLPVAFNLHYRKFWSVPGLKMSTLATREFNNEVSDLLIQETVAEDWLIPGRFSGS